MRVLYVINGFDRGGAEHGLLTLLENGFFDGHDVVVLGLCRGHGDLSEAVRRLVGPEHLRIVDDTESLSVRAMFNGAGVLIDELMKRRPDVVVLSLKQANIVGRIVMCLFPAVRCVSFEHIMRYRSRRFQWIYGCLLWLLSFRVGEIWGDCQDTIDATSRYFMPIRRRAMQVVPLFCVPRRRISKESYCIDGPLKIAVAGRLSPVKNIDKLVTVISRLRQNGDDVIMDVFGVGPEMTSLQAQINRLNLDEHVTLLGYRESWFADALSYDLYVNASDTEGFCIVVAEAMSIGLPIIATNVGGIREYGIDGVNMLKIDDPDEDSIVAQIKKLAADESLRKQLGTQAAADMTRRYSADALRAAGANILRS